MRRCYEDIENRNTSFEYAQVLQERFGEEKMYKSFVDAMGINEQELDLDAWFNELNEGLGVVEHD